jgi:transcriptional regulator with XRE-family HTH domain
MARSDDRVLSSGTVPVMAGVPMRYPNQIGACIKRYGYRYSEVAEETGIPRRSLTNYIAGKTQPPRYCLEKIARLLGCSVEELLAVPSAAVPVTVVVPGQLPDVPVMTVEQARRLLALLMSYAAMPE